MSEQAVLDLPERPAHSLPIDLDELIGEVAKRHAVMLKKSDPAFIIVTIFEAYAKRAQARIDERLEATLDAITAAGVEQVEASKAIAERIINEGAAHVARRVEVAGEAIGPALVDAITPKIREAVLAAIKPELDAIEKARVQTRAARKGAMAAAGVAVFALAGTAGLYVAAMP